MKLSSKSLTAIKLFIDLGEHSDEGFISLLDVSKRKDISKKFLEQIVPLFKNNGLLIGNRGNQGGYKLAKDINKITLKDILYVTEASFSKETTNYSPVDTIMDELDLLIDNKLSSITLKKLIDLQFDVYSNNYCI